MTIRRITVSQINGNGANANNEDEIRPYGEIGLYEGDYIQSLDRDRLELLIHNGNRTHLKSKVLSPGIFYGSNADSGDGAGLDTIKLVPDSALYYNNGSYGNDQYIVIDPTEPNHVHIRAGGTIDNSSADLILGGEKNSVVVSDGANLVVISTDTGVDGTNFWLFGSNGNLTFPNNGEVVIGGDNEVGRIIPSVSDGAGLTVQADVDLELKVSQTVDDITETAIWSFESNGGITFPDSTIQTTAWNPDTTDWAAIVGTTIQVNGLPVGTRFTQPAPTSSVGQPGDTAGTVAFDSGYIYYCTENFGGTTYEVLLDIGEGTSVDGVTQGYLVPNTYQLPQIGWTVYYNSETSIINQVNDTGIPGYYVIFVNSPLVIPGQATFAWGPTPATDIWKRVAWSNDTW